MQYLKNVWYVAALGEELAAEALLPRTLLGEKVVMYRDTAGAPVMLQDRCPHRFAPLHRGEVVGDNLQCPYHALQFDRTGACAHNPHGDHSVAPHNHVRSYPIVEKHGLLWFWPGDVERADIAQVPDFSSLEIDDPRGIHYGYLHTNAHYELVNDNLMDLTHVDYIHKRFLATDGNFFTQLKPKVKVDGNKINAFWGYRTDHVQPSMRFVMDNPEGPGYQTFSITWHPTSNLELIITARDEDKPAEEAGWVVACHFMTPETDRSCHYFYGSSRSFKTDDVEFNDFLKAAAMDAFINEDKPIIEAVQESMEEETDIWKLHPVILSSDPGPVQVRRLLHRLIEDENGRRTPHAA